jgi:hypothetical protein
MIWFLLNFISDYVLTWLVHGAVLIGFLLQFAGLIKRIPGVGPYAIVAKELGIILLVVGIFFEGVLYNTMNHKAEIEEMQAKIALAEQKSKTANDKLNDALTNRRNNIKDEVSKNARNIEAKRQSINSDCNLTNDAWLLYNRAVETKVPGSTGTTNGTGTGINRITRK